MIPAAAAGTAGSSRRWSVRRVLTLGVPLAAAAAATFAVVAITRGEAAPSTQGLSPAAFEQATGVEVIRVALTASGGAIDIRYRVTDASKASGHAGGHMTAMAVESESGDLLQTPFGMHMRAPTYRDGHTYYELVVNSGGVVEQGDRVFLVMHNTRLSDVVVQ